MREGNREGDEKAAKATKKAVTPDTTSAVQRWNCPDQDDRL
jgi:hypothetical protein